MKLEALAQSLLEWSSSLRASTGMLQAFAKPERKCRHDSAKLIKAIRLASYLKGGPTRLAKVVAQALQISTPLVLAKTLATGLQRSAALPSSSIIRRYELALDIAMTFVLRRRSLEAAVWRYGHADSSPVAGYDWFWSQHVEVKKSKAVRTYRALNRLQTAITVWAQEHQVAEGSFEDDSDIDEDMSWRFEEPAEEWCGLAEGHQGEHIRGSEHACCAWQWKPWSGAQG